MLDTVERLIAEVRLRTAGATDDTIKFELFGVLDEFFKWSRAWREDITVKGIAGRKVYELTSDDGPATVLGLIGVSLNGAPYRGVMHTVPYLTFMNEPGFQDPYKATVSLSVTFPLDDDGLPYFPDWVITRYREVLKDGLLAKMYSQPAKPYTNERQAALYIQSFRSGCSRARVEAENANIDGGQRWQFPQNFAPGR